MDNIRLINCMKTDSENKIELIVEGKDINNRTISTSIKFTPNQIKDLITVLQEALVGGEDKKYFTINKNKKRN